MSEPSSPIASSRQGTFIAAAFIVALLGLALALLNQQRVVELQRITVNLEDTIQTLHRASQADAKENAARFAAIEASAAPDDDDVEGEDVGE